MRAKERLLILGNGFDRAHGLFTSYDDFFLIMNNPIVFANAVKNKANMVSAGQFNSKRETIWNKFLGNSDKYDIVEINRMADILNNNCWVNYFRKCEANIKGWIDFENEMIPALKFFKYIIEQDPEMISSGALANAIVRPLTYGHKRMANLWTPQYIASIDSGYDSCKISDQYSNYQYGIVKENLLEDLKKELDQFIEAFRIYLVQIVENQEIIKFKNIDKIKADSVLSFNYTSTELKYDEFGDAKLFHIHGTTEDKDKMVLGVADDDEIGEDFIYFKKYFQRIRRKINFTYRELIEKRPEIIVYGHSLDINDADILRPFFSAAEKISIYYYNETDYEQKVINLIKMLGRESVEDDMYSGKIEFLNSKFLV